MTFLFLQNFIYNTPSIRKPHRRLRTAIDASRSRRSARDAPPPFEFCTNSSSSTFVCNRRMQREARSGFATSTGRECTVVLDPPSPRLRRDMPPRHRADLPSIRKPHRRLRTAIDASRSRRSARDAPPPFRFFTKNGTIIIKKYKIKIICVPAVCSPCPSRAAGKTP